MEAIGWVIAVLFIVAILLAYAIPAYIKENRKWEERNERKKRDQE